MQSQMHEEVPSDCEEWRAKQRKENQSKAFPTPLTSSKSKAFSTPVTTTSKSKASSTPVTTSSKSKASSTPVTISSKSKSSNKRQKQSNYMTLLK
jgi:hypothetical protein